MRVVAALLIGILAPSTALSQSATDRFDVASIRENRSGSDTATFRPTRNRLSARNVTILSLITYAYELYPFQIIGDRESLERQRFDLEVTFAPEAFPRHRVLLQQLLAEKFALKVRRQQREMAVFHLERAPTSGTLGPRWRERARQRATRGRHRRP